MRVELPTDEYAGYIFDCDGTLADSMPLHYRGWQAAIERFSTTAEFPEALFYSWGGVGTAEIVRRLNERYQDSMPVAELIEYKKNAFLELLNQVEPIEEMVDFARRIAASGKPVSVVSGGMRKAVDQTLQTIGLGELFDIIVTPVDVERGKPAPDMFLLAASRMGVAPSDCVVFEDGEPGIVGARAAGMATVFVDSQPTIAPE